MTTTARDIITDALMEIGVISQGESIPDSDAEFCLRKLNRLLDRMNADSPLIYNVSFTTYTLTANHQPHTIGPSGNFNVATRPLKILAANLVLTNVSPNVNFPLYIADEDWWAAQTVQALTATIPNALYYSPDWPLGNIYLWPVPTQANSLQLETESLFTQLSALTSAFSYPPGYWEFLLSTLAIELCPSYTREPSPTLVAMNQKAMRAIEGNNLASPRMNLRDSGLPHAPQKSGGFNWLTGGIGSSNK